MASEPIGIGEEKNSKDGNAYLITRSLGGKEIKTPLWIVQFATDLNLQVDSTQVRRGLVHRPVRFSERFVTFTTIWNVRDRNKYLKLGENIRQHWAFNLNEDKPTPMIFKYFGASKTWKGFIENWETAFALTDVVLSYTFSMRIALTPEKSDGLQTRLAASKVTTPYGPTPNDVQDYGSDWMTGEYFINRLGNTPNWQSIGGVIGFEGNTDSAPGDKNKKVGGTAGGSQNKGKKSRGKDENGVSNVDSSFGSTEDSTGAAAGDQFELIERWFKWEEPSGSGWFDPIPGSNKIDSDTDKKKK